MPRSAAAVHGVQLCLIHCFGQDQAKPMKCLDAEMPHSCSLSGITCMHYAAGSSILTFKSDECIACKLFRSANGSSGADATSLCNLSTAALPTLSSKTPRPARAAQVSLLAECLHVGDHAEPVQL